MALADFIEDFVEEASFDRFESYPPNARLGLVCPKLIGMKLS